jgi:hypothetical protein
MTKTSNRIELNAAELNAVSGGASHKLFDITVAGLHMVGAYSDNGYYASWVSDGKNLEIRGGKV